MPKNEKRIVESRYANCAVRAGDPASGKNTIIGRPVVLNSRTNLGPFDEIIEPGALDSTNLKDVRLLVNHDVSMIPLARSRNNNENSTLRLKVDEAGLESEADLDVENNATARELWSAVERGDVSGMSFMFVVPEGGDDWENLDTDHPTRRITRIEQIFEVSAVTWPAYEDTTIAARSAEALESAGDVLESARARAKSLDSEKTAKALTLAKAKALATFI